MNDRDRIRALQRRVDALTVENAQLQARLTDLENEALRRTVAELQAAAEEKTVAAVTGGLAT